MAAEIIRPVNTLASLINTLPGIQCVWIFTYY
jgi:hypothetical protein